VYFKLEQRVEYFRKRNVFKVLI